MLKPRTATDLGLTGGLALLGTGAWLAWDASSAGRQPVLLLHVLTGILLAAPLALGVVAHTRQRLAARPGSLGPLAVLTAAALGVVVLTGALLLTPMVTGAALPSVALVHGGATVALVVLSIAHVLRVLVRRRTGRRHRAQLGRQGLPVLSLGGVLLLGSAGLGAALDQVWTDTAQLPVTADLTPAQAQSADGDPIPEADLANSEACGSCHADITRQWSESMHRHSASDEHVATAIRWFQRDNGTDAGRLCAGCHNPIPLMAGRIDAAFTDRNVGTPPHDEGVSCLSCHAMTEVHEPLGNGSYTLDPQVAALGRDGALGSALVYADLNAHTEGLLRPLHQTSAMCGSCHQQFSPTLEGSPGEDDLEQQYAEWRHSTFAVPEHEDYARCQDCHMPLVASDDPAADDGRVRSHRFPGGNHAHAVKLGYDDQAEAVLALLQENMGLELHVPQAQIRGSLTVLATVDASGVGHRFPSGTTDISEAWLEVVAGAPEAPFFSSGLLDAANYLDPEAVAWRTVMLDDRNLPVDLHNLMTVEKVLVERYIEPGEQSLERLVIPLPDDAPESFPVRVRLRMRKANQRWNDWLFNFDGRTTPVTDIADEQVTVDLGALRFAEPRERPAIASAAAPGPTPAGMAWVPGGPAVIGDDAGEEDEAPAHVVELPGYFIDRLPITNRQYADFLADAGGESPVLKLPWAERYNWSARRPPAGTDQQPAILVTWSEAQAYCASRGGRLPSEAEWEKAARGPDGSRYPWGDDPNGAPCPSTVGLDLPPRVGMCPNRASVYGVEDLLGGVVEWTADPYAAYDRTFLHDNANEWVVTFDPFMTAVRGAPPGRVGPATTAATRTGQNQYQRGRIGFRCVVERDAVRTQGAG